MFVEYLEVFEAPIFGDTTSKVSVFVDFLEVLDSVKYLDFLDFLVVFQFLVFLKYLDVLEFQILAP